MDRQNSSKISSDFNSSLNAEAAEAAAHLSISRSAGNLTAVVGPSDSATEEEQPVGKKDGGKQSVWQAKMSRARSLIFAATSPIPFHYVTMRNIKLFAFLLILVFIIYHGVQRNLGNPDSCQWLLRTGRLQGNTVWQPDGCMMHSYTHAQSRVCVRRTRHGSSSQANSLVFIGDSRIRYLFNYTVLSLTGSAPVYPNGKHHDVSVSDPGVNLTFKFFWHPYADDSMKRRVEEVSASIDADFPVMVIMGSGTWTIKSTNQTDKAFEGYRSNMSSLLAPAMDALGKRAKLVWMQQEPVFERLLSPERKMIDNGQIGRYNWAAEEALRGKAVQVMHANHLLFWYTADSEDGIHQGNESLRLTLQILLNYHCNHEMRHRDATCCVTPEPLHSLQIASLSVFAVFVVIAVVLFVRRHGTVVFRNMTMRWRRQALYNNGSREFEDHEKLLTVKDAKLGKRTKSRYDVICETSFALAKLGFIMGYFVLCDRTDFFKKENKYYSNVNFFVPLTYIFLVGMFFSERSDQTVLLHRDQTDEWKGWMQFVILVYHMTAGSTKLPIYMHMRVLVSSYLFLNGYAHFMYFWHKGDVGAYRFFQIMFRMNLLVFCLCLVMHSPYQFYYFVPLVTFWFFITYLTMALPPRLTEASSLTNPRHLFYMVIKFVILFALITTLYVSETFFDHIFLTKPWAVLFLKDNSGSEWFFRWRLDRYSVLQGMVFGFVVSLARRHGWLNETFSENLFALRKSFAAVGVGILGLVGYLVFALLCPSKTQCNEVHTYVEIVPILGFIAVRNTFGVVRRRFSTLFAWAGRLSLELFIVQFHVWLAADTYGVLVFIPGSPMLNVMFTSFIYLCVAHEVHEVTGVLAEHLVPKDWKYLVMAVGLFGLLLSLLAACYGL
ncbi:CAS1 domain-containing protein 1 [Hypsibius exemplaris]|uniref:CAS1 domain-containing protein 1 n=1 Tax=Hypsibius exemplaris TaxID=2072580 RepID=A0A9X6NEJ7_HYPEX|nr:CAS1 domain-containing protein 1 [Hypsibius exemplaris]